MPPNPARPPAAALLALVALGISAPLAPAELRAQEVRLDVTNRIPEFLNFFQTTDAALATVEAEREARLREQGNAPPGDSGFAPPPLPDPEAMLAALWQEMYGFVPPDGSAEQALERLGGVWERYPAALPRIGAMEGGISPDPAPLLREVVGILEPDRPVRVELVVYVGTFDRDPGFILTPGGPVVLVPAEQTGVDRRFLVHAFAEATQAVLSGRAPDRPATLAEHLLARGVALRAHEALTPGRPAEEHLGRPLAWLLEAERNDRAILEGLRGVLDSTDPETVRRFRSGSGATGTGGELDYAAWRLAGQLFLQRGWTLERLARIPANEIPALLAETIDQAIGGG